MAYARGFCTCASVPYFYIMCFDYFFFSRIGRAGAARSNRAHRPIRTSRFIGCPDPKFYPGEVHSSDAFEAPSCFAVTTSCSLVVAAAAPGCTRRDTAVFCPTRYICGKAAMYMYIC